MSLLLQETALTSKCSILSECVINCLIIRMGSHFCNLNEYVLRNFRLLWFRGIKNIKYDFSSWGPSTQMVSPSPARGGKRCGPRKEFDSWCGLWLELRVTSTHLVESPGFN